MKDQKLLAVSLGGNLLLLVTVVYLGARPPGVAVSADKYAVPLPASPAAAAPASAEPIPATESNDFRWSQLESTDYRTYITNLRHIGCPQQTLRDIITADVDSLYAPRRSELQKEQDRLTAEAWHTPRSQLGSDPSELLAKLKVEENALLVSLLGPDPHGDSGGNAAASGRSQAAQYKWPLAFLEVDTHTMELDPYQQKSLMDIRRRFAYEMSRDGLDRNSPEYASRWQMLQKSLDKTLCAKLGYPAYQELEGLALSGRFAPPQ